MPPARKDPPQADDPSRPSTSRAFSPALAPPVKRARTSGGGAPAAASRRQSTGTGGGRQARMEEFIDEKELQDRLLEAVTATADEILKEDEEEGKEKIEIENEVISAAAGIVWDAMAEDWATDLLAFSRHAGRETIREEDVKLLMRRNPLLLAEILGECEGEEDGEASTSMGTIRRRSTGGLQLGRPRREPGEEMETFDGITTPMAASMESVVPETPQGIVPLAHSTPIGGRSVLMRRQTNPAFSIPSPIREDEEEENGGGRREGRRANRSILDQLSGTMEGPRVIVDEDNDIPLVNDVRHPREQEDEARRMRMDGDGGLLDPSTNGPSYVRAESPELFDHSDQEEQKKGEEYDSFDDDFLDAHNDNERRGGDASHRMSESAALREMWDEEEEEKEKTVTGRQREDSFDDNSIQFVEEKKSTHSLPIAVGDFPSTSAARTAMQHSSGAAAAAAAARAAAGVSATSQRSSQDSFYRDDFLDDPPQPVAIPAAAAAAVPIVQQPPTPAAAAQPVRPDDYDSFEDDDDDFVAAPSRSKENTPRAIGGPSPSTTVANRWSTVEIEEVPATQKNSGRTSGVFAEDIFGLNNPPAPSKPTPPINRPSPTVPTRPPPTATIPPKPSPPIKRPSPTVPARPPLVATVRLKPSPTVPARISPTVPLRPAAPQSTVKATPASNSGKVANGNFTSFSFFAEESPATKTPAIKREDSDFLETSTSTRQTPSATRTPRGRGGARGGRGFPRKVDPDSKVNRMIREQSTPVRLSPRPPSRISEVVGSFEDDDFDSSAFDD